MARLAVGDTPPRAYPGVITSVAAPLVFVQLTDDPDLDTATDPIPATGTGTAGDKVTVLVQPSGRAILMRS
jgi:hypothetical protein